MWRKFAGSNSQRINELEKRGNGHIALSDFDSGDGVQATVYKLRKSFLIHPALFSRVTDSAADFISIDLSLRIAYHTVSLLSISLNRDPTLVVFRSQ